MTPLDLPLLAFLGRASMKGPQIGTFMGCSQAAVYRRMRRMRDLRQVRVHAFGMEQPNRYTLAPAGRQTLVRVLGEQALDLHVPRTLKRTGLEHHEATVDVVVKVIVASAKARSYELVEYLFERDIRKTLGATRANVRVPDALVVLGLPAGGRHAVAIEIDRGTERPSYFAAKARGYSQAWEDGQPLRGCASWSVACSVSSKHARRRVNRLIASLWEDGAPESLFFFSVHEELQDESILTPTSWTTARLSEDGSKAGLCAASPFQIRPTSAHPAPSDRLRESFNGAVRR